MPSIFAFYVDIDKTFFSIDSIHSNAENNIYESLKSVNVTDDVFRYFRIFI